MLGPVALPVVLRTVRARATAAVAATVLGSAGLVAGFATTTTASAQILPTPTLCVLSTCVLGTTSTTTTTTTTSSTSSGLCILVLCNPSGSTGNGTTTTTTTTTSTSSSTCALTTCVSVNPSCSVQSDPTCLISTSTSTTCTSGCGGGGGGGGGNNGGGGGGTTAGGNTPGGSTPRGSSTFLALGGGGLGGGTEPTPGSSPLPFTGLSVATVPVVQTLSPVSGLQFGHAPILWPVFGALDLLGLVAVYLLVRRSRAARSD